jgi:hypothetical protein
MDNNDKQPTIDERLQALTHSLELMQLDMETYRAEQERLDKRERRAREALLSGIAAYLRALSTDDDTSPEAEV